MEQLNRPIAASSGAGMAGGGTASLGRVRPGRPRAVPPPYASIGPADFAQQESMVQVGAATRISVGCQWFYISRDEYGYTISSREYPEWRLTTDDFAKLVGALSELLVEQIQEEQLQDPG